MTDQLNEKSPHNFTVHLFTSNETPTRDNLDSLYLIEPWDREEYSPQTTNLKYVKFSFNKGDNITIYGYFIRSIDSGEILFAERFNFGGLILSSRGDTICVDISNYNQNCNKVYD